MVKDAADLEVVASELPAERRWALQTAIRRGEQLPAPVREQLAKLVGAVGYLVEDPEGFDWPPAARWSVTANAYGRLVAAGAAL